MPWTPLTTFFWTFLAFWTAATGAASLPASPFFSPFKQTVAFQIYEAVLSMVVTFDLLGCWLFAILGDLRGHCDSAISNVLQSSHAFECIIYSIESIDDIM